MCATRYHHAVQSFLKPQSPGAAPSSGQCEPLSPLLGQGPGPVVGWWARSGASSVLATYPWEQLKSKQEVYTAVLTQLS